MGMTGRGLPLVLAALVAAGCSNGQGGAGDGTSSSTGSSTAATGSSSTDGPSIRDVDLGNRTWEDGTGTFEGSLTLQDGEAPYGETGRAHLDDAAAEYLDVDGDGHLDVALHLTQEEGNGVRRSLYVWLWDPQTSDARQVLPAITSDLRCGDVTKDWSLAEPGTIVVERLVREGEACGAEPTNEATAVVSVQDGYAWQTQPRISALQCPYVGGQGLNFPGSDLGKEGPRAWPSEDAPVLLTGDEIQALDITPEGQSIVDGWNQLMFVRDDSDKGGVPPCGYYPVPS